MRTCTSVGPIFIGCNNYGMELKSLRVAQILYLKSRFFGEYALIKLGTVISGIPTAYNHFNVENATPILISRWDTISHLLVLVRRLTYRLSYPKQHYDRAFWPRCPTSHLAYVFLRRVRAPLRPTPKVIREFSAALRGYRNYPFSEHLSQNSRRP